VQVSLCYIAGVVSRLTRGFNKSRLPAVPPPVGPLTAVCLDFINENKISRKNFIVNFISINIFSEELKSCLLPCFVLRKDFKETFV